MACFARQLKSSLGDFKKILHHKTKHGYVKFGNSLVKEENAWRFDDQEKTSDLSLVAVGLRLL